MAKNYNENYTLSYAGHYQGDGGAIDLTIPFQPDALFLYNYTAYGTARDNVECIWFRDFPAGDALLKTVIVDNGSTADQNLNLETTNGVTENNTLAAVLDSHFAISAATAAAPVVLTTAAHGITVGAQVRARVTKVAGMVELNDISRNPYLFESVTATTGNLLDLAGNNIDGTGFTAYTSGGQLNIINHLTGEDKGPFEYADDVWRLTLGTATQNNDNDEIYFIAWRFGEYIDLGDQT